MARQALANLPVEPTNVSPGGDLPVVIADPTTPGNKLAIDGSGRITIANPTLPPSAVDTELPAAGLLGDGQALPTAPQVGAVLQALGQASALDLLRTLDSVTATNIRGALAVGRVARSVPLFNALAIRDTGSHDSQIDISQFSGGMVIDVYSSLDQPIDTIRIQMDLQGIAYTCDIYSSSGPITAPGRAKFYPAGAPAPGAAGLNVPIPQLDYAWTDLWMRFACSVAPTSGTVTVMVRGRT